jgi:repressor LexA
VATLTDRQQEVLTYIESFIEHHGWAPTRKEICDHFKFKSSNAANDHLISLEKKGYIQLGRATSRGIKINDPS